MFAHVVDCDNCAHCVELYTPKESDAEDLKKTREEIKAHVSEWLKGSGFSDQL
jgi:hypothetical protein